MVMIWTDNKYKFEGHCCLTSAQPGRAIIAYMDKEGKEHASVLEHDYDSNGKISLKYLGYVEIDKCKIVCYLDEQGNPRKFWHEDKVNEEGIKKYLELYAWVKLKYSNKQINNRYENF